MHPSIYMLEKELLEHKIVTRLPLFILLFSVLLMVLLVTNYNVDFDFKLNINMMAGQDVVNLQHGFSSSIAFVASGVSYMLSILYLSKTLRKESQEGSLAFWRSMPVSDLLTHWVKLVFALLVIPFICSMLVLSSELFLWLVSMFNPYQINTLIGNISVLDVLQNYFNFLYHMLFVGAALLPFACFLLAISQLVNSPLLVAFIAIYALKIVSAFAFAETGLEQFFNHFIDLPLQIINSYESANIINHFVQLNTLFIYLVGGLFLLLSLSIRKHGELSIAQFFKG